MKSFKKMTKAELAAAIKEMYEMVSLLMPEYMDCGSCVDTVDCVWELDIYCEAHNSRRPGDEIYSKEAYIQAAEALENFLSRPADYDELVEMEIENAKEDGDLCFFDNSTLVNYADQIKGFETAHIIKFGEVEIVNIATATEQTETKIEATATEQATVKAEQIETMDDMLNTAIVGYLTADHADTTQQVSDEIPENIPTTPLNRKRDTYEQRTQHRT